MAVLLGACSGSGAKPVASASAPAPSVQVAKADGIYQGRWGRVGGADDPTSCPADRTGVLSVGDNTMSLDTDETTTFVIPLPSSGPIHAVEGVRGPDGRLTFATTSPKCTMRFDLTYLPGF
jgi:hypothetical protein